MHFMGATKCQAAVDFLAPARHQLYTLHCVDRRWRAGGGGALRLLHLEGQLDAAARDALNAWKHQIGQLAHHTAWSSAVP